MSASAAAGHRSRPVAALHAGHPTATGARTPADARTRPLLRPLTLAFLDGDLERRYQVAAGRAGLPGYRLSCAIGVVLWLIAIAVVPVDSAADGRLPILVGLLGAGMNIGGLVASRWTTTIDRQNGLATPIAIVNGLAALILAAAMGVTEAYAASALILIGVYFFVARVRFLFAAVRIAVLLVAFGVAAALSPRPSALLLDAFMLVAALGGVLLGLYRAEVGGRRLFHDDLTIGAQAEALARENATSERLLQSTLPASIARRLRESPDGIADEVGDATVLFADLVGFTAIAHGLGAAALVDHLDDLFSRFDGLAAAAGVEKIKTIGDAYMAVGGIPEPLVDHPRRLVELGLEMIATVDAYAAESGLPLALRVGVHSGPLVAGVIGTARFSYDLWGDTVNIASRLESGGSPGAVHVSQDTWDRLGGAFHGEPRGRVQLKGVGTVLTWLVRAPGSSAGAMPAAAVAAA